MGTFIQICGFGLAVAFVWMECSPLWGILALAVVLLIVGEAIDRGEPNGTAAKPGEESEQRE